jgi:hypothetical protein
MWRSERSSSKLGIFLRENIGHTVPNRPDNGFLSLVEPQLKVARVMHQLQMMRWSTVHFVAADVGNLLFIATIRSQKLLPNNSAFSISMPNRSLEGS